MLGLLDEANVVEVRLIATGEAGTVVPSRLEPPILTDSTRDGFFDSEGAATSMRLAGNVDERYALVHDLLPPALLIEAPEVPRPRSEDREPRQVVIRDVTAIGDPVSPSS